MTESFHPITIGEIRRSLPIREVAPGVRVALFNILGDWELTEAAGVALAQKVPSGVDFLVMADGKAQALLHVMGREKDMPILVARKERKPYMGNTISVHLKSITTDKSQELHINLDEALCLLGMRVAIVDDVVSSGGTVEALKLLLATVGAVHVATLAVFTEGTPREDVISLGHLPLF
jgi:adenine phosphoribosyltransferase